MIVTYSLNPLSYTMVGRVGCGLLSVSVTPSPLFSLKRGNILNDLLRTTYIPIEISRISTIITSQVFLHINHVVSSYTHSLSF